MASIVTFAAVAHEWWKRYMVQGSVHYAEESWRRLEREVMPWIGDKPIAKISSPAILAILRRIEQRGTLVVARKVKSHISQIMRYGIACGFVNRDPSRDLGWALTPHKCKPRAAIIEPRQIGQLMYEVLGRGESVPVAVLFATLPVDRVLTAFLAQRQDQYGGLLPRILQAGSNGTEAVLLRDAKPALEPVQHMVHSLRLELYKECSKTVGVINSMC